MRKNTAKLLAAGMAAAFMMSGCGGSTASGTAAPAPASSGAEAGSPADKQGSGEKPAEGEKPADGEKTAEGEKPAEGERPADGQTPPEKPEEGGGKNRQKGGPGGHGGSGEDRPEGAPDGQRGSGEGRPEGGHGEKGGQGGPGGMPGGAPGQSATDIEYTALYAPAADVRNGGCMILISGGAYNNCCDVMGATAMNTLRKTKTKTKALFLHNLIMNY